VHVSVVHRVPYGFRRDAGAHSIFVAELAEGAPIGYFLWPCYGGKLGGIISRSLSDRSTSEVC
jgi:hypothetical protein